MSKIFNWLAGAVSFETEFVFCILGRGNSKNIMKKNHVFLCFRLFLKNLTNVFLD